MASPSKPTIVLVPGAWHKSSLYHPLTSRLEKAGYTVHALDYPSTAAKVDDVPDNFDGDVVVVQKTLKECADRGESIVLVVHSAGGIIGGSAAQGFSQKDRQTQGLPGGIVRMVYICAFAAEEGVSLWGASGGAMPWYRFEGRAIHAERSNEIFYNCCPPELAKEMEAQLGVFAQGMLKSEATYAAWKHIPCTYLVCEQDNAIPLAAQEGMIAQPGNKFDDVVRCDADHSPFLCMPDLTAEVVRKAAGEAI